jgi:hypothetical protein
MKGFPYMILLIILTTVSVISGIPLSARKWIAAVNVAISIGLNFFYPDEFWTTLLTTAVFSVGFALSIELLY